MLSDLRDSGAIEQDADVVLGLYRPGYYERPTPDAHTPQEAEINVLKARDGETGRVPVYFVADRTYFFS
jgi:replicative DNA helicase